MDFAVSKPCEDETVVPNIQSARMLTLEKLGDFVILILEVRNGKEEREWLTSFLNQDIIIID